MTHSPPVSGSLDGDPMVPPGCELLRHGSQRHGLTTFTVVPQRRPQSMRQYEFLLTMEKMNGDAGGNLEGSSSESRKTEKTEMVMLERIDAEFENVEETNKELGITEAFGKLNLNMNAGDGMEDRDERDWIEEYRERRRFLSNDDHDSGKEAKSKTSTKAFDEEIVDDVPPPSPQLPVCWEEEGTETQNLKEAEVDQATNTFPIQNPNTSRCDPISDGDTQDPDWDVNLSSNFESSKSDAPSPSSPQSSPRNHQPISVQSTLPKVSKSELDPGFERSSPNSPSLFALAVSQRVQSLGNAFCPLIPSTRRISSPTQHPQSVGSQNTSSQKLYFQNLISQEFISKSPACLGACNEAPPTSAMTPQARRQAWVSCSRTQ